MKTADLKEVISRLASGAQIILDAENYPHLRDPQPCIDGPLWNRLHHEGWLEQGIGGTFKLSEAGYLAYVRSTDELRDVGLEPPIRSNPKQGIEP